MSGGAAVPGAGGGSDSGLTTVHSPRDRAMAVAVAIALAALGLLPVANWLAGGEGDRAYARRFIEWGYGTTICLGVGVVAALLLRGRFERLQPGGHGAAGASNAGASRGIARRTGPHLDTWLVPLGAFALYAWIARAVFSGRPLLIDEIVQVFQARIFASGRLWIPVSPHPEFFSILHVVDTGGKVYSQFPPGGPAMLAIGELLGAPWLVGPAFGAAAVALFSRLMRCVEPQRSRVFHVGATLLFAVAPFGAFMFGSHMNHATALTWLLVAMLGLARLTADDRLEATPAPARDSRLPAAFATGLGLGVAATIRPLDAFAFAVPTAAWLVARAVRDSKRWPAVVMAGVGVAIPFGAMMWVNARSTGSPLLFGYEILWGKAHGLGFHTAPWGAAHTPERGLELLSLYVTRLQTYLFETPFPSVVPAIAVLALTRRLSPFDRYLLTSATLLGALYFAYWHDGFFLGPRFVFPWLPVLVLLSARLPAAIRREPGARTGPGGGPWSASALSLGLSASLVTGAVLAATMSLPARVAQYRGGLTSMRVDYTAEATRAGVRNALVFVRESWGAQIITRLWARDVSRSAAAALYRGVDACLLDKALREIERTGVRGTEAERRLAPLLSDSARVRSSPLSPDSTEKLLPGATYDRTCIARINQDRAGYTHLAPLLLERGSGNVYARDLHARDSLLLAEHPARPAYVLRRRGAEPDAPYEWLPLRRDSVLASWRSGEP